MYKKNSRIKKNIFVVLLAAVLLCVFSTAGMADTGKNVPAAVKKYIGKTYWSKTYYFGDSLEPYVCDSITNKKIMLNKDDFFTKMKITGYKANGLNHNFIALINGKTCLVDETIVLNADPKDYSIFDKDPKSIFKWSPSVWKKLSSLNPFFGMTPDMLKMIRGNYSKLNKVKEKGGVLDVWVYLTDVGNEYFYFKDGKLIASQG